MSVTDYKSWSTYRTMVKIRANDILLMRRCVLAVSSKQPEWIITEKIYIKSAIAKYLDYLLETNGHISLSIVR